MTWTISSCCRYCSCENVQSSQKSKVTAEKESVSDMNNQEMLAKARKAKTQEELLAIAQENGVEMDAESAQAYFEQLHQPTGEMSDDELDAVAGGACYRGDGRMVTTVGNSCRSWRCKQHNKKMDSDHRPVCIECGKMASCNSCKFCTYEKGLWLCNYEGNRKR